MTVVQASAVVLVTVVSVFDVVAGAVVRVVKVVAVSTSAVVVDDASEVVSCSVLVDTEMDAVLVKAVSVVSVPVVETELLESGLQRLALTPKRPRTAQAASVLRRDMVDRNTNRVHEIEIKKPQTREGNCLSYPS